MAAARLAAKPRCSFSTQGGWAWKLHMQPSTQNEALLAARCRCAHAQCTGGGSSGSAGSTGARICSSQPRRRPQPAQRKGLPRAGGAEHGEGPGCPRTCPYMHAIESTRSLLPAHKQPRHPSQVPNLPFTSSRPLLSLLPHHRFCPPSSLLPPACAASSCCCPRRLPRRSPTAPPPWQHTSRAMSGPGSCRRRRQSMRLKLRTSKRMHWSCCGPSCRSWLRSLHPHGRECAPHPCSARPRAVCEQLRQASCRRLCRRGCKQVGWASWKP